MPYPVSVPRDLLLAKTKRAYKHILEYQTASQSFFASNPYEFTTDNNYQLGERTINIRFREAFRSEFLTMIGDVLSNLRSSLDHLAYHLVTLRLV